MPSPHDARCVAHVDAEHGFSGGEVQVFLLMEGLRAPRARATCCFARRTAAPRPRPRRRGFDTRGMRDARRPRLCRRGAADARAARARPRTSSTCTPAAPRWLGGLAALARRPAGDHDPAHGPPVCAGWRTRLIYDAPGAARGGDLAGRRARPGRRRRAGGAHRRHPERGRPDALAPTPARRRPSRAALGRGPDDSGAAHAGGAGAAQGHRRAARRAGALARAACGRGCGSPARAPTRGALEDLARELGVAAQVRFLGRRDDAADLLAALRRLRAAVAPRRARRRRARGDGRRPPGGRQRASAAWREAVVDGRTGLLVPPDDAAALAAALARLLRRSAAPRRAWARAGPARVREGFLPSRWWRRTPSCIASVLRRMADVTHEPTAPRVRACVITLNEEDRIGDCLARWRGATRSSWSTRTRRDRTRELAAERGRARDRARLAGPRGAEGVRDPRRERTTGCCASTPTSASRPSCAREIAALRDAGFPGAGRLALPRLSCYLGRWIRHGTWYPDRSCACSTAAAAAGAATIRTTGSSSTGRSGALRGDSCTIPYRSLAEHLRTIDTYTTIMARRPVRSAAGAPARRPRLPSRRALPALLRAEGAASSTAGAVCCWRYLAAHYVRLKYAKLLVLQRYESGPPPPPPAD